jgi:hypothetical protein
MQISSVWLIKVDQFQFLAVLLHFFDDEFHGRVLREKLQLPYLRILNFIRKNLPMKQN